jgi:hypothetical protein
MPYQLEVVRPTAISQGQVEPAQFARSPQSLEGKRIGLLWNTKRGGDTALKRAGQLLKERFPTCQVTFYTGMMPAPKAVMEEAKKNSDVVLGSSAD